MSKAATRRGNPKSAPQGGLSEEDMAIFAQYAQEGVTLAKRTRAHRPRENVPAGFKFLLDQTPDAPRSRKYYSSTKKAQADALAAATAKEYEERKAEAIAKAETEAQKVGNEKSTKRASTAPSTAPSAVKPSAMDVTSKSATKPAKEVTTKPKPHVPKKTSAEPPIDPVPAKPARVTSITKAATPDPIKDETSSKKRPRQAITKVPEPVVIVAPQVPKSAIASLPMSETPKPPKKRSKQSEDAKMPNSPAFEKYPIPASQLVSAEPKIEIPSILNTPNGIYAWREGDSEEARLYEYSRVWHSQPAHTEAWKNIGDTPAQTKERTYGEVTLEGMMALFEELKLTKDDVFVDIGSGLGNLVFYASFVKGAKMSYGIEVQHNRHVAAEEIRDDLALLRKPYWDPASCQFVYTPHHDVNKCPGIEKILGNATVIFVNNILFSPSSNAQCISAIYNIALNARAIIFTSNPAPRASNREKAIESLPFKLWKSIEAVDACSWCSKSLKYFIYRPFFLAADKSEPLPHFLYGDHSLTATAWTRDPNDSQNDVVSEQTVHKANGTTRDIKAPPKTSRFQTKHSLIAVPEDVRMAFKKCRRAGIAEGGIKTSLLEDSPSSAPSVPSGPSTPRRNGKSSGTSTPKGKATPSRTAAANKGAKTTNKLDASEPAPWTSKTPKPLHNLLGDHITYLIPQMEEGKAPYHEMIFEAFHAARICANRPE